MRALFHVKPTHQCALWLPKCLVHIYHIQLFEEMSFFFFPFYSYLFQFQNATNNPLLMQIHQQMQMLSRQLYDIESTNALQLRIISKLLSKLIKVQQWPRNILARFFRFLQVLFIVLMGPFVVKAIRRLFCK
uniref:Transmembrane protein n=1 Tax=Angiostrongylus cantonensis TaxID=6313 RepID=A0A0K0CXN5_ANGCA